MAVHSAVAELEIFLQREKGNHGKQRLMWDPGGDGQAVKDIPARHRDCICSESQQLEGF